MMLLFYYMRNLCIILICMTLPLSCQGLRCWHCVNRSSNSECIRHGALITCAPTQNRCQNELRYFSNGRYYKITKGCKQANGCINQSNQSALNSYMCGKSGFKDVCWCCCNTDNCNKHSLFCHDPNPPHCRILSPPSNGIVRCTRNDSSLGTKCFYRCHLDYYVVGTASAECIRTADGADWSSKAPICKFVTCKTISSPARGSVTCSKDDSVGSICRFACDSGYRLIGSSTTRCGQFCSWTNPVPICRKVLCSSLPRAIPELDAECTNGNKLGSTCRFSCSPPYQIEGDIEINCLTRNGMLLGRWSGDFPKCSSMILPVCPFLDESSNLSFSCTNTNFRGSACEISCPANMILTSGGTVIPEQLIEIECTAEGWSRDIPECQSISCPRLQSFENGEIICTQDNRLNSNCRYRCDTGYRLLGKEITTCQIAQNVVDASWSSGTPACIGASDESPETPVVCPNRGELANGVLSCGPERFGNGTHWLAQTVCKLRCSGELYSPVGEKSTVTCTQEGWIGQVCCDRCLSTPRLDIITLLDSSNVDEEKWEIAKNFIHGFVRYITEYLGYELDVHIIPYSSSVDAANKVKAPNIVAENFEEIFSFTQSLPFSGGGESNTGLALRYVNDEVLGELQEGSIPLVVIVTNQWPDDISMSVIEATTMREYGIHIRVIPLLDTHSADPGSNLPAFSAITGREINSILNSNSEETFYQDATAGIEDYDTYCEDRISTC